MPDADSVEITVGELVDELRRGVRCALQVRHAERTKIDPADVSFGEAIPITPDGERAALRLGEMLAGVGCGVSFVSSPHRRTLMTARCIARGMGLDGAEVAPEPRLGNGTFYFADRMAVYETFRDEGFFDSCFRYFRAGELSGFGGLHEASDALERWLVDKMGSVGLLVAVTHDSHIAAFLAAKAGVEFSRDNWPRFLDGAAVLLRPDGSKRYALVRAGLSDAICGIDSQPAGK